MSKVEQLDTGIWKIADAIIMFVVSEKDRLLMQELLDNITPQQFMRHPELHQMISEFNLERVIK